MAAYVVALVTIHDMERFKQYGAGVREILARHGGKPLANEDPAEVLEGEPGHSRVVLIEFPNKEAARAWEHDPDYQALSVHRHAAANSLFYLVGE